jgi:hypothetical protein
MIYITGDIHRDFSRLIYLNDKNIELLDGMGKGIEEDCGGSWGLTDLINNKNNS